MDTVSQDGSDDEEGPAAMKIPLPINKRKRQTRAPLPTNISSRLLSLGSTAHISTLAELLVSPTAASSVSTLVDFSTFTLGLLAAFKGTARWESILDGLLEGRKGMALTRRLWREGVRGKWSTDKDAGGWHSFQSSTCNPSETPGAGLTFWCRRHGTGPCAPNSSLLSLLAPYAGRRVLCAKQPHEPTIYRRSPGARSHMA